MHSMDHLSYFHNQFALIFARVTRYSKRSTFVIGYLKYIHQREGFTLLEQMKTGAVSLFTPSEQQRNCYCFAEF